MDPKDRKDVNTGISNQQSITPTGTAATRAKVLDSTGTPLKGTEGSEQKYTNVVNKVSEVASNIANKVSENVDYDKIRNTAGDVYNKTIDVSKDVYNKTIDVSKQRPALTLGISLGVGILLGYLIAPKRPRYYSTVDCLIRDTTNLLVSRFL
jgi:ElaB/YqjD/DUF883 family membrane-anchored ribosome-binding protein